MSRRRRGSGPGMPRATRRGATGAGAKVGAESAGGTGGALPAGGMSAGLGLKSGLREERLQGLWHEREPGPCARARLPRMPASSLPLSELPA